MWRYFLIHCIICQFKKCLVCMYSRIIIYISKKHLWFWVTVENIYVDLPFSIYLFKDEHIPATANIVLVTISVAFYDAQVLTHSTIGQVQKIWSKSVPWKNKSQSQNFHLNLIFFLKVHPYIRLQNSIVMVESHVLRWFIQF